MDLPCRILNHMAIDPIQLTKQLVDIESTTYHEGLAGAFLHEFSLASAMTSSAWLSSSRTTQHSRCW